MLLCIIMNLLYNPFRGIGYKHPTFTREQLRRLAKANGVKRGRNTQDTIANLKAAGINV